jgi:hypothetical protein
MYNRDLWYLVPFVCLSFFMPLGAEPLPEQLAGWTRTEGNTYAGQALYDYIDGGADLYMEYGFVTVNVGYYSRGEREILVEVYTMSNSLAATGVYTYFRKYTAPDLPEPYTGKLYDSYLECLNGSQYVRVVNYDSLNVSERLSIFKDLIPEAAQFTKPDYSKLLPPSRIPGSEVIFNGPIALKNFCPLGRKNLFGVGKRVRAWGCLIEHDSKNYKWTTLTGDSTQLSEDTERFVAFQRKNDYAIQTESNFVFLEDQLSGQNMALTLKGDRIYFLFGIETKEEANGVFNTIH